MPSFVLLNQNTTHAYIKKFFFSSNCVFPGSRTCPVQIFTFYLDKLNKKRVDLWQRPKKKVCVEDPDDVPGGRDTLNDVMKSISTAAELSKVYTNHSIRSTAVTTLDSNNIEAHHIQTVSGHKSEVTIRTYSKHCAPS